MDTVDSLARLESNHLRRHLNHARTAANRAQAAVDDTTAIAHSLSIVIHTLQGLSVNTDLDAIHLPPLDPRWSVRSPLGPGILTDASLWASVETFVHSGDEESLLRMVGALHRRLAALERSLGEQQAQADAAAAALTAAEEAATLRGMAP